MYNQQLQSVRKYWFPNCSLLISCSPSHQLFVVVLHACTVFPAQLHNRMVCWWWNWRNETEHWSLIRKGSGMFGSPCAGIPPGSFSTENHSSDSLHSPREGVLPLGEYTALDDWSPVMKLPGGCQHVMTRTCLIPSVIIGMATNNLLWRTRT